MTKTQDNKAVIFVDVADSTTYYDRLGNEDAQTLMAETMDMISDIVLQHNGTVIKTIGDAVMAMFSSADEAVLAVVFMQQIFATNPISHLAAIGELKLCIGLNFGDVVLEQNDAFGNAVIIAARLAAEAKAAQILTTKETIAVLAKNQNTVSRFLVKKQLKGLHEPSEIYEILGSAQDTNVTTVDVSGVQESLSQDHQLVLRFNNQVWAMGQDKRVVTMGRSEDNDIILTHPKSSRQHAKIELTAGKYVFTDKSANGSYVVQSDGVMLKVHMEHITLYQSGVIFIGGKEGEGQAVGFAHEAA